MATKSVRWPVQPLGFGLIGVQVMRRSTVDRHATSSKLSERDTQRFHCEPDVPVSEALRVVRADWPFPVCCAERPSETR